MESRFRIESNLRNYRFRFPMLRAPVASPTMTMTTPIGKVKIVNKGVEPRVVLSFSASSTKIDATRLKRKGDNPKITPPNTINDPRFL